MNEHEKAPTQEGFDVLHLGLRLELLSKRSLSECVHYHNQFICILITLICILITLADQSKSRGNHKVNNRTRKL